MHHLSRYVASAAAIAAAMIVAAPARADDDGRRGEANRYVQTNLTSDLPGVAPNTDPVLQNAWGVAFTPAASPFWISDNATGCSTLYDGRGCRNRHAAAGQAPAAGRNGAADRVHAMTRKIRRTRRRQRRRGSCGTRRQCRPPAFWFRGRSCRQASSGTPRTEHIAAWTGGLTPANQAVLAADNSQPGAVYKGLVFGVNAKGVFLFATNFRAGTIDVFDLPAGTSNGLRPGDDRRRVQRPENPAGFAPFGIQNINGDLFVTYAKQNAAKA